MTRKYKIIAVLIVLIIIVSVFVTYYLVVKNSNTNTNSTLVTASDEIELPKKIERKIISETMPSETELQRQINDIVTVEVFSVENSSIRLRVTAPNISDDLYNWLEGVPESDFSELALNQKITALLENTEPITVPYELEYEQFEEFNIRYTEEYYNAVSCGLNEFYRAILARAVEEVD